LLARIALARADLSGALALLDQTAELDRASARTSAVGFRSLRGDVLARLGREKEAESDFRSEVSSHPENLDGWARLALLYASQGRGAELDDLLSEMTRRVPTPRGYDAALRVARIIGDPARVRDWTRRRTARFGAGG
ncbi:MAG TPA: hypothetical protein VLE54_08705, partial [Thermoanaerobaculia bacterium]|nr:hypothetical protein [Thermoanaerobaculia bacterium]